MPARLPACLPACRVAGAVDSDDHEGDEQQPSLTVTVLPLDRGADDDDDDDAAPPLLVDVTKTGGGFLGTTP